MTGERKNDTAEVGTLYRSDRMFSHDGKWFFQTREGTFEGPYPSAIDADRALDGYIRAVTSELLPSGDGFSLEPKEPDVHVPPGVDGRVGRR